mmetsp:Transcript_1432/g.3840  ORF Transcript_1432/g.3840 Transcript_1432/m.3840 type:complete len:277 (-) Transcript_1432:255-1085(-)
MAVSGDDDAEQCAEHAVPENVEREAGNEKKSVCSLLQELVHDSSQLQGLVLNLSTGKIQKAEPKKVIARRKRPRVDDSEWTAGFQAGVWVPPRPWEQNEPWAERESDGCRLRSSRRVVKAALSKSRSSRSRTPRRVTARSSSSEPSGPKLRLQLYKMGEFCCDILANFVRGNEQPETISGPLLINQRTKMEHCQSHMERAGDLATVWYFSAADRRDCAAYDALCDYFIEKQRVGLVEGPTYYVYLVPPSERYIKQLGLPSSNFVIGVQVPMARTRN